MIWRVVPVSYWAVVWFIRFLMLLYIKGPEVSGLKAGEGLIVLAPFLPSPLIEKLGSEGFASKVERGSGADWMVYFWREAD